VAKGLVAAIAVTIVIASLSAFIALVPSTDDFDPANPLWNGLSQLYTAYHAKLVDLSLQEPPPGYVLLIVGPSKPFTRSEALKILSFLRSGGRVVILDDYGYGAQLLHLLDIDVELYRGVLEDPLYYYRSYALPRIEVLGHALYMDYGTAFKRLGGAKCVGYSSYFSYIDTNLNYRPDRGEPRGPLCVAIEVRIGRGTLIFVSDADIAINGMWSLNSRSLQAVLGSRHIAIVVNHLIHSPYTLFRSAVIGAAMVGVDTWLRYPLAVVAALLTFVGASRLWSSLATRRELEVEKVVKYLLAKHPEWRAEDVEKVVREVLWLRRAQRSRR